MLGKNKSRFDKSPHKEDKISLVLKNSALGIFAFLVVYATISLTTPFQNTSATDTPEDCDESTNTTESGSICRKQNQNLSVTVNNNPLFYYITVRSDHGASSTPISMAFGSEEGRTALGNLAFASDSVYVESNSPLTHQLLLSTTGTYTVGDIDTSLVANNLVSTSTVVKDSSLAANTYFAPGGGNSLTTAATLGQNTWGFALASNSEGIPENNFDPDYSNPTKTSKWAKVPNSGNEILVRQDNEPTSTTTIYYGVYAEKNIVGGEYGNVMLYTALAEQPTQIRISPKNAIAGATLTVYTSINTTNITGESATIKFYQESTDSETGEVTKTESGTCTNPTVNLDTNNYLYVTCTVPALTLDQSYGVELALSNLSTTLYESNIFTYKNSDSQSEQQIADNTPSNNNTSSNNSASPTLNTNNSTSGNRSLRSATMQSSSSSSSDTTTDDTTNNNTDSTYNTPLGVNNADAKTTASVAGDSDSGTNNAITIAAAATAMVAAGGIAFFIIKKREKDEKDE